VLKSGSRTTLRYADIRVDFESRLWLSAPSGTGKSMFSKAITGVLPQGVSQIGSVSILRRTNVGDAVLRTIYVPQSPSSALPTAIGCKQLFELVEDWRP
jgi:ABC-type uncharacterized transport system fused permease/ATPase subunit